MLIQENLSVITEDTAEETEEEERSPSVVNFAQRGNSNSSIRSSASRGQKTLVLDWMAGAEEPKPGKKGSQHMQLVHLPTDMSFAQAHSDMRNWILLDSQSTVSSFCNPSMVERIYKADTPMTLSTNAGEAVVTKQADVPNWGRVLFHPEAMTNIFSLSQMSDKYRVTYDSAKEQAFVVHTPQGQLKFRRSAEGLHYYIPPEQASKEMQHLETVKENKSFYTD